MGVLKFRLFGFPVHVQPGFWLAALLLASLGDGPIGYVAFMVAVLFVSIVTHELGHALIARAYGQDPTIVLHMMGGLTAWRPRGPARRLTSIMITLAGPSFGLLLGIVAALGYWWLAVQSPQGGAAPASSLTLPSALYVVAEINLFWSVINLLPVLPFDGGQVLAVALGPRRRLAAATISLVAGLVTGLLMWRALGFVLGAMIFVSAGILQFVAVLRARRQRTVIPNADAAARLLAHAQQAERDADPVAQRSLAQAALTSATTAEQRVLALELLVRAALSAPDFGEARRLARELGTQADPRLWAAIHEAEGNPSAAVQVLQRARETGDARPQVAAQQVRLLLSSGSLAEAGELTLSIAEEVPTEDLRGVAERLAPSEPSLAAKVWELALRRDGSLDDASEALTAWHRSGGAAAASSFVERTVANPALAPLQEPLRALAHAVLTGAAVRDA